MNTHDCITCNRLIDHLEHTGISKEIPDMLCEFKHMYIQNVYFKTGAIKHCIGEYEANCATQINTKDIKSLRQPNIHKLIQLLVTKYGAEISISRSIITVMIFELNHTLKISWNYIPKLDMYTNIEWALNKYFDYLSNQS